jgi:hypothetical protein
VKSKGGSNIAGQRADLGLDGYQYGSPGADPHGMPPKPRDIYVRPAIDSIKVRSLDDTIRPPPTEPFSIDQMLVHAASHLLSIAGAAARVKSHRRTQMNYSVAD